MADDKNAYIDPVSQESLEEAIEKGELDPGSAKIIAQEQDYIRGWREARGDSPLSDGQQAKDLAGLSLSGGGIRSATFSLGIMQALAGRGLLKKFDYLSTVSGGGYIGSSITWLTSALAQQGGTENKPEAFSTDTDNFPYGTDDPRPDREQTATPKQKHMLRYLRAHGYYLTPGAGINAFSLLGAILRGTVLNLMVWIPVFIIIFLLLMGASHLIGKNTGNTGTQILGDLLEIFTPELQCPKLGACVDQKGESCNLPECDDGWQTNPPTTEEVRTTLKAIGPFETTKEKLHLLIVYEWALLAGGLVILLLLILACAYSVATWFSRSIKPKNRKTWYLIRRWVEKAASMAMPTGIVLILIGIMPLVAAHLHSWLAASGPVAMLAGIAIALRDFKSSSEGGSGQSSGAMINIGAGLFLYGIAVTSYLVAFHILDSDYFAYIVAGFIVSIVILGLLVNLNYISIHRYYRDRLMETFMPDIDRALRDYTGGAYGANAANLQDISLADQPHGPYHIVNTNALLVSSENPVYKSRGGDNFILSPLYCGSNATGWQRTDQFMDGKMTLATAVAISGAAANPNTGVGGVGLTRNLFVSLVMSLLNLRLGYWAYNPNPKATYKHSPNHFRPGAYALGNAMGYGKGGFNETRSFIQLSDGGHFENMGLYELIRRRVKLAIVCDGGADLEFSFSNIQTTICRIEDDFGARIKVLKDASPDEIVPTVPAPPVYPENAGYSKRGYMLGHIGYANGDHGWLIFLKTTMIKEVSFKVKGYKAQNPTFPDETTADQFFDEVQFEAYRELGYCIADQMLKSDMPEEIGEGTLEQLIGDCGAY